MSSLVKIKFVCTPSKCKCLETRSSEYEGFTSNMNCTSCSLASTSHQSYTNVFAPLSRKVVIIKKTLFKAFGRKLLACCSQAETAGQRGICYLSDALHVRLFSIKKSLKKEPKLVQERISLENICFPFVRGITTFTSN